MSTDTLRVMPAGGTTYQVYRAEEYLGSMEHDTADDDEIIEAAREQYSIPASVPGTVG